MAVTPPNVVAMDSTNAKMSTKAEKRPHGRLRRWRLAAGIALVEGVVVALSSGVTRWTVIALAVAAVALYATVGRSTSRQTLHEALWIFAFSQALAVVVAIASFFISWIAYALAALLAVVVLVLLAVDRLGDRRRRSAG